MIHLLDVVQSLIWPQKVQVRLTRNVNRSVHVFYVSAQKYQLLLRGLFSHRVSYFSNLTGSLLPPSVLEAACERVRRRSFRQGSPRPPFRLRELPGRKPQRRTPPESRTRARRDG